VPEDLSQRIGRDFATDYDIDDPRLAEHWDEIVDDLQARCPVARSEVGEGYWVVNRYDDVRAVAGDWETFSSADGFMPNRPAGMPLWYPVECDPPLHDELRAAINPYLGPKAIAAHEEGARAYAEELIDRFAGAGEADVVRAYAAPLPGLVFCGLVANMPTADMQWLQETLNAGIVGPADGRIPAIERAHQYMREFLARRREEPARDDLVNALLTVEIEGYDDEDRAATLSQLTAAGLGTTSHTIASAIFHFARHPDEAERFMAEPSIRPRAVEEFVRIYAASPHDGRRCIRDTEVAGTTIKAGDFVLLGYGAGSRDPAVTPDPRRIDFDRAPNRHVAFGAGIHRCAGAHLARIELRVALETFLERLPDFRVDPEFDPPHEMGITRSMMELPVTFTVN
jgi:cytochrome P450